MAKPRGIDARLQRLRAIRQEPITPDLLKELRSLLDDSSNLVVADAAEIAGERALVDLAPDNAAAFERSHDRSGKRPTSCAVPRSRIAGAAPTNSTTTSRPFSCVACITGSEPIFGTDNDMAWPAARQSARSVWFALNYRGVVILLADMLLDKDIKARTAAVTALGETGSPAALPLLRFKARIGDVEPSVTGECLSALIRLDPFEMLPFVAGFSARLAMKPCKKAPPSRWPSRGGRRRCNSSRISGLTPNTLTSPSQCSCQSQWSACGVRSISFWRCSPTATSVPHWRRLQRPGHSSA